MTNNTIISSSRTNIMKPCIVCRCSSRRLSSRGANDQRPVELVAAVPAQSMVKIIEVPQITLGNNQFVEKPSRDAVILMPKVVTHHHQVEIEQIVVFYELQQRECMVAHSLSFPGEVVHGPLVVKAKEVVVNTTKLVFADRSEDGEKEVLAPIVDVVVCGGGVIVSHRPVC